MADKNNLHSQKTMEWQNRRKKAGLCMACGEKAIDGLWCLKHKEYHKMKSRNHYRKKHDIPLDKPGQAGLSR